MSSTTGVTPESRKTGLPAPEGLNIILAKEPNKIHLLTPPGIGDFAWVYSKLWSLHNTLSIKWWVTDHWPKRVGSYLSWLGLDWGEHNMPTDWMLEGFNGEVNLSDLKPSTMHIIHINRHLENGRPISEWMSSLPYQNPMFYPDGRPRWQGTKGNYAVLYASQECYSEGNLHVEEWIKIAKELERIYDQVIILGASWDVPMAGKIIRGAGLMGYPHCLCKSLTEAINVCCNAAAFIGLNGGLSILTAYAGVPTVEAYPTWLTGLRHAWPTPDVKLHHTTCSIQDLPEHWRLLLEFARNGATTCTL